MGGDRAAASGDENHGNTPVIGTVSTAAAFRKRGRRSGPAVMPVVATEGGMALGLAASIDRTDLQAAADGHEVRCT
ncbi:hypothetical protein GCM10027161_69380 [Microbispora hainanensis]